MENNTTVTSPRMYTIILHLYLLLHSLLVSVNEAKVEMIDSGFKFVEGNACAKGAELSKGSFATDEHLENLFIFHRDDFDIIGRPWVTQCELILQEKASCLPVACLAAEPGSLALDAFAAPANKTSQLAASIGTNGKLIAFEKDAKRFETLSERTQTAVPAVLESSFVAIKTFCRSIQLFQNFRT